MIWDCPAIVRLKDVLTTMGAHCISGSIARGDPQDDCWAGGNADNVCASNGSVADDSCSANGITVG